MIEIETQSQPQIEPGPEYRDTKEVAKYFRVSKYTVDAWLSKGLLKRTKAGGRTLVSCADLADFVRRSNEPKST